MRLEDAGVYACEATNTLNPTGHYEYDATGVKKMHIHVKCKYIWICRIFVSHGFAI